MTVPHLSRFLRIDDVRDELREGDVMPTLQAELRGLRPEFAYDVDADGLPEIDIRGK